MFTKKYYSIAIIGASGLVGETLLKILEEKNFPIKDLYLFASEKSNGKRIIFKGKIYTLQTINERNFSKCDFTFLTSNCETAKKYANLIKKRSIVIDNSSYYRLRKNIPLIIPEINGNTISEAKLIANPNCTTAIVAIPLFLLNAYYGIEEINFTTFQAVSGSGKNGINALKNNNSNHTYPYDITKTCIPLIGEIKEYKFSEEELKMRDELRKILNDYALNISATCVRVPIENCHSVSVLVKLKKGFSIKKVKRILSQNKDIVLVDDTLPFSLPNAINANGSNKVFIGRLRKVQRNTLLFYIIGDNLRRGAAYNAYKIMEYIINNDSL